MATASAGGSGSCIASVPKAVIGDLREGCLSARLLVMISGLDIGGDSRDRLCMAANSPVNGILHHFSKDELGRSCFSHLMVHTCVELVTASWCTCGSTSSDIKVNRRVQIGQVIDRGWVRITVKNDCSDQAAQLCNKRGSPVKPQRVSREASAPQQLMHQHFCLPY